MGYTVTVKIDLGGAPLSTGVIPHTWVELRNTEGAPEVRAGFFPRTSIGEVVSNPVGSISRGDIGFWGRGEVRTAQRAGIDDAAIPYQPVYEVTKEQYEAMHDYIQYRKEVPGIYAGLDRNCTDFVRTVLKKGGVPHSLGAGPGPATLIPPDVARPAGLTPRETGGGSLMQLEGFQFDTPLDLQDLFGTAETVRSPIVLDLNGDGVQTIPMEDGSYFDHAGDGFAEKTGWSSEADGILALDRNLNGSIDSGAELFGDGTRLANGSLALHGFQALGELDSNGDGQISAADAAFGQMLVWRDFDGDGATRPDEISSLPDLGILSINLGHALSTFVDANGNAHRLVGSFQLQSGAQRQLADVYFRTSTILSIDLHPKEISRDIDALLYLPGMGTVSSLHQAIAGDFTGALRELVEQFVAGGTEAERDALLFDILVTWAGASGVSPTSRGPYVDARVLVALEAFMGQDFLGTWCWGVRDPNPHSKAAPLLNAAFGQLRDWASANLMAQTHLRDFYDRVAFVEDQATGAITADLEPVAVRLGELFNQDAASALIAASDFGRSLVGLGHFKDGTPILEFLSQLSDPLLADAFNTGAAKARTYVNNTALGTINGTVGADIFDTRAGTHTLVGFSGNDVYEL